MGKGSKRFDLDTLFRTAALARVGLYLTRTEQEGAQGCDKGHYQFNLQDVVKRVKLPREKKGQEAGSRPSLLVNPC